MHYSMLMMATVVIFTYNQASHVAVDAVAPHRLTSTLSPSLWSTFIYFRTLLLPSISCTFSLFSRDPICFHVLQLFSLPITFSSNMQPATFLLIHNTKIAFKLLETKTKFLPCLH